MPPSNWALVRQGDVGPRVSAVQLLLRAHGGDVPPSGSFDPATGAAVRQFQAAKGVAVDGVVGNQTWPALVVEVSQGSTGDAVRAVQVLLPPLAVDGVFGPQTDHRVKEVQFRFDLGASGVVGADTWLVLTSVTPVAPAQAVVEPDSIAGVGLASPKSEATAVLGPPLSHGTQTDVHGDQYDFLHWQIDGSRGLTLNYRFPTEVSPKLTDWHVTARGPATRKGVRVGDSAEAVVAAYGPLEPFVGAQIASVEKGGGRMIVIVSDGVAESIVGGDDEFWMRSIAT